MSEQEPTVATQEAVNVAVQKPRLAFVAQMWRSQRALVILVLAVIVLGAISGGLYTKLRSAQSGAPQDSQVEIENLVAKVGQLIVLPEGEVPTVATITDPKLLKDQAFFANAQQGNKVLIFAQARKAILYDPLQHKIVEVAPINLGTTAPTAGGR